jgi:hypothetical protein
MTTSRLEIARQVIAALFFSCLIVPPFAIAMISVSAAMAQEASSGGPGTFEVLVFDGPDFSGRTRSFELGAGQSYAYVEQLGDDQAATVRSLKVGASVAVVLFRRAFFMSQDQSCVPTLGSDRYPDLIWTGATAAFLPERAGDTSAGDLRDAGEDGYASVILYRRDLGPPLGALLMKRERSYSRGCGNVLRSFNFNRRFVPLDFRSSLSGSPAPAEAMRGCVNLKASPEAGLEAQMDLLRSDRIALLQPSDLDARYESRDRRFRVLLFDADDCRGESVSLLARRGADRKKAAATGRRDRRDILLSSLLFRDRVRSLRVEMPDSAKMPLAEGAATKTTAPTLKAEETGPAETPAPEKPASGVPGMASKTLESQAVESARKSPRPVPATLTPEPSPATSSGAASLSPVSQADPVPALAPVGSAGAAAYSTPSPPPSRTEVSGVQPSRSQLSRPQLSQTQTAPREPEPAEPEPLPGTQVFTFPVYDVYRLNYCLSDKGECGEPAAARWCRLKGFERAVAWKKDSNIGGLFPTFILGDETICAQYNCDGFAEITCGP